MDKVRFGVSLSTFNTQGIVELGIVADKLGFHSVWVPDHLSDLPPIGDRVDPWVLLGAIGANSKQIMLFPGVTDPTRIHPAKTANVVATLDDFTGGRAGVGIGAGEVMNLSQYGMPWEQDPGERRTKLKESIQVMRGLFHSSLERPFSFDGVFFRMSNARLDLRPVHPVKFYIGSLGTPKTLELIGEIADGWFPVVNSLDSYKKRSAIIERSARASGRDPVSVDKVHSAFVIVSDNLEKEKKDLQALKPLLLTLSSTTLLKDMREASVELPPEGDMRMRISYQHMNPSMDGAEYLNSIASKIPDEVVRKYAAVSKNFEGIREQLEPFVEAGASHIVIFDVHSILAGGTVQDSANFLKEFSQTLM